MASLLKADLQRLVQDHTRAKQESRFLPAHLTLEEFGHFMDNIRASKRKAHELNMKIDVLEGRIDMIDMMETACEMVLGYRVDGQEQHRGLPPPSEKELKEPSKNELKNWFSQMGVLLKPSIYAEYEIMLRNGMALLSIRRGYPYKQEDYKVYAERLEKFPFAAYSFVKTRLRVMGGLVEPGIELEYM